MKQLSLSELKFEDIQKVYSGSGEFVNDARVDLNKIIGISKAKAGILSLYDIVKHIFTPELFIDNNNNDIKYNFHQTRAPLIDIDQYRVIKDFTNLRKDIRELILRENIKSIACFPIFVEREIEKILQRIGEVVLFSEYDDILINNEVNEGTIFTLYLERLLLRARSAYSNGRMHRRIRRLEIIRDYANKIEGINKIEDILKATIDIGFINGYKSIYGSDSGFIIRLLRGKKLEVYNYQEDASLFEESIDAEKPLFKKVLDSRESTFIDDPQNHPDFKMLIDEVKDKDKDLYEFRKDITSLILTPFWVANKPRGIFILYERKGLLGVSERHFLENLALITSLAFKNLETYKKAEIRLKNKVRRLKSLNKLTKSIIAKPNEKELLKTILNSGLQLVRAQSGNIRKFSKETGDLKRVSSTKNPLDGDIEKIVLGKGICGMVAGSGKAMKVDDACSKEFWREILIEKFGKEGFERKIEKNELMRSEISAPLVVAGETIGTIDAHRLEPNGFTDEDLEIFEDLANLSAIVIKRQELSDRLAMVRKISNFYYLGVTNHDLIPLLKESIMDILIIMGITKGAIALTEIKDGISQLKFVCVSDISGLAEGSFRKIGIGFMGKAAAELRLINIDDVNDVLVKEDHIEIDKSIQSVCISPICFAGKLQGIIMVASKTKKRFSKDDELLLAMIANHIAILVHNVQSLKEKEENFKRMENETIHNMINMSGMMAHQIKNPLMFIQLGAVNIEKKTSVGNFDFSENLKSIKQGISSVDQIIDQIQTFVTKQGSELHSANIHKLLDETVEVIKGTRVHSGHIKIIKNYSRDISEVRFSHFEMTQVFMNIFSNAYDAMKNQGDTLKITTKKIDNMVEIEVEDNGEGIPEEIKDNIFKSFFTTKHKGSGLGLAISKRFVEENHHGKIKFTSDKGMGTRFLVSLSLQKGE